MRIGKSGIVCAIMYVTILVANPFLPRLQFKPVRVSEVVRDTIAPEEVGSVFRQRRLVLLDVRMPEDCGSFTLRGCPNCIIVRMPTTLGTTRTEDEGMMAGELLQEQVLQHPVLQDALKAQTLVMVMCCKGVRSEIAQRVLKSAGFNATHVGRGMLSRALPDRLFRGARPVESGAEEN